MQKHLKVRFSRGLGIFSGLNTDCKWLLRKLAFLCVAYPHCLSHTRPGYSFAGASHRPVIAVADAPGYQPLQSDASGIDSIGLYRCIGRSGGELKHILYDYELKLIIKTLYTAADI